MRLATGKVSKAAVVLDGAPFQEGETVTVIAPDDTDGFELGAQDEALLLAAIAEADRGDLAGAAEVLAALSPTK